MLTSTPNPGRAETQTADVLIPLIRAAATIGFAIAPCSLGFVIIAVSEQLIRSIMVGEDPEMLVSDLQNEFPHDVLAITDRDEELVAQVVDAIDGPVEAVLEPQDLRAAELQRRLRAVLKKCAGRCDREIDRHALSAPVLSICAAEGGRHRRHLSVQSKTSTA